MTSELRRVDRTACVSRRRFFQTSGLSVAACAFPRLLQGSPSPAPQARQAIVILLQGGCSHLDTFDLKPAAPAEYRGEFRPIASSVPGCDLCEHLPLLAARTHQFNVLRSVHHGTPSHEAAIHWVLTGYDYPGANTSTKNRNVKPAQGSVVARLRGPPANGLPPYVCIPDKGQLGDRVRYAGASFLGLGWNPFESGPVPEDPRAPFSLPPNLTLSAAVDLRRFDHRLALLRQLDQLPRAADADGAMEGMDQFNRKAWDLLLHDATRTAFDLSREPAALREKYGSTRAGQRALLARRLAEAGVPFTLVNFSNNQDWDTHENNFRSLRTRLLPPLDRALSTLLDDLEQRGLLETTLVALISEFGRTPKINNNAGRDHWSDVFTVLLTGGGLKRGQVLGTSNPRGEIPQDRPLHYNDVVATIYHQLGVPLDSDLLDQQGRPVPIVYNGAPIAELV